jgi:hypothetical protein
LHIWPAVCASAQQSRQFVKLQDLRHIPDIPLDKGIDVLARPSHPTPGQGTRNRLGVSAPQHPLHQIRADAGSARLEQLPAKGTVKPVDVRASISLCDKGSNGRVSIRPAEESATAGSSIKLADPVRRNRPGRRSSSTLLLMASSNSGARWISSITARSRLRIIPAGSSRADRSVSSSSKVR